MFPGGGSLCLGTVQICSGQDPVPSPSLVDEPELFVDGLEGDAFPEMQTMWPMVSLHRPHSLNLSDGALGLCGLVQNFLCIISLKCDPKSLGAARNACVTHTSH